MLNKLEIKKMQWQDKKTHQRKEREGRGGRLINGTMKVGKKGMRVKLGESRVYMD